MIYIKLFIEFFRVGLFSVGGGLATLPFLQALGIKEGWFTSVDLANILAVSESTPGPIGINMSTYVGYNVGGYLGGMVATIGLITPSVIIIMIISHFIIKFKENKYVNNAFYGLRPASIALIASAGVSIFLNSMFTVDLFRVTNSFQNLFNFPNIILGIFIYIGIKKFDLHPIVYIAIAAVIGVVFKL